LEATFHLVRVLVLPAHAAHFSTSSVKRLLVLLFYVAAVVVAELAFISTIFYETRRLPVELK